MQKKIISLALACAVGTSALGGFPGVAAEGERAFSPSDYLQETENGYLLSGLNQKIQLHVSNQDGQLQYSVDRITGFETQVTKVLVGDLDLDEEITIADVMEACKVMARESTGTDPTLYELTAGDIDEDEEISIADVMEQCKMLARQSTGSLEPTYRDMVTETGEGRTVSMIEPSDLGAVIDGTAYGQGGEIADVQVSLISDRTIPLLGNQTEIEDRGVAATFTIQQGRETFYLDARVYDDGVAFRYRFPGDSQDQRRTVTDELTQLVLPSNVQTLWAGTNNKDSEPRVHKLNPATAGPAETLTEDEARDFNKQYINLPMTFQMANGDGYVSIMEGGASTSFPQINMEPEGNYTYKANTSWSNTKSYTATGDIITGWRIINGADDLNGLVNNYNIYKVNPDPDADLYADTSYIQPGRATWTWLTDYGNPSCKDPIYSQQFMEAASKLGFEYSVIDEGWYSNEAWQDPSLSEETYVTALTNLGNIGKQINVKPILWTSVTGHAQSAPQVEDLESAQNFVDLMQKTGMAGAKIDFWASEDNPQDRSLELQKAFLEMCAEAQLLVNFHGINEPTGLSVTYPNEITREAVRGLENIGNSSNRNYATQAKFLTRQLFTRFLAGHADWTPATDTAMQIASLICIDSPLNVIATHPNDILSNEAVEMIKSIPTVWDQTLVLPVSEIDKLAVYAKESKGTWFVGGIYHNEDTTATESVRFDFDFLDEGTYQMEMWIDTQVEGVQTKQKVVKTVTNADSFRENIPANGGFAIRLSKLSMSQYGGEILDSSPLTLTAVDPNAVIKYTTDGSDPMTSQTAVTYQDPIVLEDSCKVRAAIVSGDGAGTQVSHQFNTSRIELTAHSDYGLEKTLVTLDSNKDVDIYYTTDGTEPTQSSDQYTDTLTFTEDCTLKALAVSKKDGATATVEHKVGIMFQDTIEPNLYLSDYSYDSAHTAWDAIGVDTSCKNTPISIGGQTFSRGVGVNANGYFVYTVPENAEYIVGTVGIDDVAKENTNDGHKASGNLVISFDEQEAWSSVVFTPDQWITFKVAVPEGAKQVRIDLLDGGDGITCDNISIGNAGWLGTNLVPPAVEKPAEPDIFVTSDMVIESKSGWGETDYIGIDAWPKDNVSITVGNTVYVHGLCCHEGLDGAAYFKLKVPADAKKIMGFGGVDTAACAAFSDADGYRTEAKANFKFIFRDSAGNELGSETTDSASFGETLAISYDIPAGTDTLEIQFLPGDRTSINFGYASIGNFGFMK